MLPRLPLLLTHDRRRPTDTASGCHEVRLLLAAQDDAVCSRMVSGPSACSQTLGSEWQHVRTEMVNVNSCDSPIHYCRRCGLPKNAVLMWCARPAMPTTCRWRSGSRVDGGSQCACCQLEERCSNTQSDVDTCAVQARNSLTLSLCVCSMLLQVWASHCLPRQVCGLKCLHPTAASQRIHS